MTRRRSVSLVLVIALAGLVGVVAPAGAKPPAAAANPAVITQWNAIAVSTIAGPAPNGAGKANAEAFLWFAFVQAAVYNAVVGITGEYELYKWNAKGPKGASPQAAAAAAAHGVLMEYFGSTSPAIATNLDAALATSLGQIPDGVPKKQGVHYGERAADRLIRLREDDGRFAPITFDVPETAGVWRPTPPGLAQFFDPWLGQVDPLVLDSLDQFRPGPPPPISSDLYEEEFEEVRDYGVMDDATHDPLRTDEQTETALFFSDIGVGPLQAALRDRVMRHELDISDSARLFAAVDLSIADAVGAVWDGKYYYGWWRPITAIREGDDDGNPNTVGDSTWLPLVITPPYPDWPSGLGGVIGAASTALVLLDGAVDLNITSAAAGPPGSPVTRPYETAAQIQQDVIDARVWSGIHFRTADKVGVAMGTQVASWALAHYFAPTN